MKNWNKNEYQRIIGAKQDGGDVIINFANDDIVVIAISKLLPYDKSDLEIMSIAFNDFELLINEVEVPWDRIRVLTDSDFAKEMSKQADENARQVGDKLKSLREAKKMKAFDLADRAGLTPQTISRIEKGHTDVTFATLRRILAAMGYTLKDLASVEAVGQTNSKSLKDLIKKLTSAGLDSSIVYKIIPKSIQLKIGDVKEPLPVLIYNEITAYLRRVFEWTDENSIESENFMINDLPFKLAFYKTPAKTNVNQLRAYSHYAYFLSRLVTRLNNEDPKFSYPGDIDEFKALYFKNYIALSLSNLVDFCWDLGIAVLPLNDAGVFHGASWNIEGKHVIVLKQKSQSHAKWIFDLLHEIYHVFVHLEETNSSILETDEIDPFSDDASTAELEANAFANQVIFGKNSDELAIEVLEKADYKIEYLKQSLQEVCKAKGLPIDFLANYLAFRLQHQGHNWWPVAASLQVSSPTSFNIVSDKLRGKISIDSLNPIDRNILMSAIVNS